MPSPRVACLDDFELAAIIDGSCAPEALSTLLEHTNGCASCRALLTGLMAEGTTGDPLEGMSAGHYRFGPLLAEGGMGRVYRAVDLDLDRAVAIKVPRTNSPALKQRFEREISISVRLAHPGVVPIHGTGKLPDGTPFYVMRFVDGDSLDVLQSRAKTIAERLELVGTLITVAETMGHVHSQHIAHRDLKPNNVLVGRFGEVVIIDWGLAKELPQRQLLGPRRPSFENMAPPDAAMNARDISDAPIEVATRAGDILGTPAFMAPEQAKGEAVDRRADVYGLGAMLWHVLTGRIPRSDAPFDESALLGIPAPIATVTRRAMSINRELRYADASAFAKALREAVRTPSTAERDRKSRLAWRSVTVLAIGTAAAITWRATHSPSNTALPRRQNNVVALEPTGVDITNNSAVAVSPSGNRIAVGGQDRLTVRDMVSRQGWTSSLAVQPPLILQFNGEDSITVGDPSMFTQSSKILEWNYQSGKTVERSVKVPDNANRWLGSLDHSELFSPLHAEHQLFLFDHRTNRSIVMHSDSVVESLTISPDRTRFAFADSGKFNGVITVVDSSGTAVISSDRIQTPTGLTWFDDSTLLYSTKPSGATSSYLFAAKATPDGLRHPTQIYRYDDPNWWIGGLKGNGNHVFALLTKSTFQSVLVDITDKHPQVMLDTTVVSAPLAWRDGNSFWAWNLGTHAVELHDVDEAPPTTTRVRIDADPANATRAGDILIVALRAQGGRRIEAYSLTDGSQRWKADPGALLFVRCAGDDKPPCVAGRQVDNVRVELCRIDPATGQVGDVVVDASELEDTAVSRDGTTLAYVPNDSSVVTQPFILGAPRTLHGEKLERSSAIHSIAFDSTGSILVTRRGVETKVVILHPDGTSEQTIHSTANILSFIRPSPDGSHLFYRARRFDAELSHLVLPAAVLATVK